MNCKDNRRVQMTRKLLRDSLLDMLKNEEIHKISIRTLCENADINRSTFYKHYSSQYDVLKDMEDILLTQIQTQLSQFTSKISDNERFINILTFLQSHLDLCKMLINSNVDPEFPKRLLHLPAIQNRLTKEYLPEDAIENMYVQDFFLYGCYHMIQRWINDGCKEPPSEIARIIEMLSQNYFSYK